MPFSLGRSYDDLPESDSDGRAGSQAEIADKEPATEIPAAAWSPTYRLIWPIVGVVAIGLCLVGLGSKGFLRESWLPVSTPSRTQPALSSAAQTPIEGQANASEDSSPSRVPSSAPPELSPPLLATAALPTNPWSADIPEAACIPADLPETGRVVEVLDADTIRVLMDRDGRVYSVHYLGVAAAESRVDNALLNRLALTRNIELVYRRPVVLVRDISDADSSGALLRYVMADDVFVNQVLIQEGWARIAINAPDTACQQTFLEAQQQAQRAARGLWSGGATPTPTR